MCGIRKRGKRNYSTLKIKIIRTVGSSVHVNQPLGILIPEKNYFSGRVMPISVVNSTT